MLSAKVSPPPRAKAQTGALRAKTAILLTWTMDLRPRSSPTFSRAGPQWRPFGQAAGRPALSDAGAAADSGKNSSSQLRASRFVALSLEAFYDSSYTSSDEKTGYIWFLLYRMRGESQALSTSSVSLRLTASPHRGSLGVRRSKASPSRGGGSAKRRDGEVVPERDNLSVCFADSSPERGAFGYASHFCGKSRARTCKRGTHVIN